MAKVKILKKLPKTKKKYLKPSQNKAIAPARNQFKDNYLNYYDDIKVPSKKYDW